jgi:hypothetical protein
MIIFLFLNEQFLDNVAKRLAQNLGGHLGSATRMEILF